MHFQVSEAKPKNSAAIASSWGAEMTDFQHGGVPVENLGRAKQEIIF